MARTFLQHFRSASAIHSGTVVELLAQFHHVHLAVLSRKVRRNRARCLRFLCANLVFSRVCLCVRCVGSKGHAAHTAECRTQFRVEASNYPSIIVYPYPEHLCRVDALLSDSSKDVLLNMTSTAVGSVGCFDDSSSLGTPLLLFLQPRAQ